MWGFESRESSNKMLGEDALRTVECLRGRLQAQRAASRAAEQNAELMAKKLKELEKQLKIEAKCRRKAEKKLNFLKKKLESLNIPFRITTTISEEFDGSFSSNNNEISCMPSIASTSFNNQQDENLHLESQLASKSSSITSEITEERESESNVEHKLQDISKHEQRDREPTAGGQQSDEFCHGLDECAPGKNSIEDENEEKQDHIDTMALVPVTSIIELNNSSNSPLEVKSEKVREVLDTLKQIRENLQNSLEKRRIIQVG